VDLTDSEEEGKAKRFSEEYCPPTPSPRSVWKGGKGDNKKKGKPQDGTPFTIQGPTVKGAIPANGRGTPARPEQGRGGTRSSLKEHDPHPREDVYPKG